MLSNPEETKNEIVKWIRDYMSSTKADIVVGISGGKDSSVTAALCTEALGKERVVGVMMPNGIQSDIADSQQLVDHLGIRSITVNIKDSVDGLIKAVKNSLGSENTANIPDISRDTMINLPARIRMTTLYAIAQSLPQGARVANTCNRSEDYIGYSTKYGDSAGDFSPLANLLVHEVIQLGKVLGLPSNLVNKVPADGLSGKSDEEKIGFTYAVLDKYILTGECDDVEVQKKIDRMHVMNLHKLQPMPAFKF